MQSDGRRTMVFRESFARVAEALAGRLSTASRRGKWSETVELKANAPSA